MPRNTIKILQLYKLCTLTTLCQVSLILPNNMT